jgi:hypothetical protein
VEPVQNRVERPTEPVIMCRIRRRWLALGALFVAGLAARPALAQQGPDRAGQSVARESWHEARRRAAAERRAALLEWHRARRAGLAAQPAAPAGVAAREGAPVYASRSGLGDGDAATAGAAAIRTASLEWRAEPMAVAGPESRLRVLGPIGAREDERDARAFDRDRFERGRDRFRYGRGRRGFGHQPWGRAAPFGLPYGFEDLVCVARLRDPFLAGVKGFGPYGRGVHLRARCLSRFGLGFVGTPYSPFFPYGLIGDPLLRGFPYSAAPLPAPHRFSYRFFPPASALPWPVDDAWLPDDEGGPGIEEPWR